MTAQKSLRKKFSSLLATGTAVLLAASGLALAPTAAFAADEIRDVTGGTASGVISTWMNAGSMGRPSPLPAQYVAPASFDAGTKTSSWGEGTGELNADGSATLAFGGKSVNFAPTGGGWLTVADLEVELDADGNGVVSADVAYGTAPGAYPNIVFDPEQTPDRGVERLDIIELQGNESAPVVADDAATWAGLEGVWTADFLAFLAGDEDADPVIPEWSYASTVNNSADDRKPSPITVSVELEPGPVAPTYSAAVSNATDKGLSVTGSFTGATGITIPPGQGMPGPSTGVYVALIEEGTAGELSQGSQGIAAAFVTNAQITDGAGGATLNALKEDLDRSKSYEVLFWYAHSNPTDDTTIGSVPLTVTKAQWDAVFPPKPVDPKPTVTFTDVKKGQKFYTEIAWMAAEGISTGVKQANGTYQYQPKNNVTREAMAAFLYRQYGDKNFKAPSKSPFTDVKPGDKFYQEIAWMASEGISTGVKQANGTVKFQPKSGITREAMAAFMYRIDEGKKPAVPAVSPFADVRPGDKFYREIAWMSQSGLSTGIKQPSGKPVYAAKSNVTREAMAAFLYRAER
jgi:hypothetical protein